jgi:dipeptidyl aminopeptidase/acylaminoacyl peptidase
MTPTPIIAAAVALLTFATAAQQTATGPRGTVISRRAPWPVWQAKGRRPRTKPFLLRTADTRVAVSPVSEQSERTPGPQPGVPSTFSGPVPPQAEISPDGMKYVFVRTERFNGQAIPNLCLTVGGKTTRLTNGVKKPREPRWMPDSKRVVYVRGTGDKTQLYITDTTSEKRVETRVSAGRKQSWKPRIAADGRVAYLEQRRRDGKAQFNDIVIWDGSVKLDRDRRTAVVQGELVSDHAWSPDGAQIAFSTTGELIVLDLATKQRTVFRYADMDDRLFNHHAESMDWKDDGTAIVCRLVFSGGRSITGPGDDASLFGDREVFIIPVNDPKTTALHYFRVQKGVVRVEWWEDW